MHIRAVKPMVVAGDPCLHCDARQKCVCGAVPDDDLARLAAMAVPFACERGGVFINEGEPADDFFNVTRGTAKLFKLLPDGRQQITGFASAGHFLGLAVSDTYAFSAMAIEPVQACRLSRRRLKAVIEDFPALERRLLATACNELVIAQEQMLLLGRKTAQERLASFLVAWSYDSTLCHPVPDSVRLPMTRGDIADHLGLTIETVSRTFSRFRADGRITTPSNTDVVIVDRPWLESVAAGYG